YPTCPLICKGKTGSCRKTSSTIFLSQPRLCSPRALPLDNSKLNCVCGNSPVGTSAPGKDAARFACGWTIAPKCECAEMRFSCVYSKVPRVATRAARAASRRTLQERPARFGGRRGQSRGRRALSDYLAACG